MRLAIVLLAILTTYVLGTVVFHLPSVPFFLSISPLVFIAGYMSAKEDSK